MAVQKALPNPAIFTVSFDGRTGIDSIWSLMSRGYCVSDQAAGMVLKSTFVMMEGVVQRFGIIKGDEFPDEARATKNIWAEASHRGWLTSPSEAASLLREIISDEEIRHIGLQRLVVMHEPIDGVSGLLALGCDCGGGWFYVDSSEPDIPWDRSVGFLFLTP